MSRRRATKSAHSDSSDVDVDGTELEKAKLLRHYRIMDADRQAYSIQTQQQMRKQQQEIEKLSAEQEELRHKLSVCKSLSRQKKDKKDAESFQAMLEKRQRLEEEFEKEMQHQKELQEEISNVELKLKELRKGNARTSDTQKSAYRRNQEAVHALENKLERALTRFNEQLIKNCHLREELQTLHGERIRFQRLHNRLVQELQDIRKKVGEAISLSTAAHDARVEAQSKLAMMREKAEKDLAQYNTEMRELERVISHECNLKDFIATKYSEKTGQEGTEPVSNLRDLEKKDSSEESTDDLEAFFQRIQSVTGEEDPELLVSRFIQAEDRNFALFNFVNEQNNEAEALRNQISQIQKEMEHFKVRGLRQEEHHRASLRDVSARQKDVELQTEDFENRAAVISKVLQEVKIGVSSIVSKVECDVEDSISDSNIMPYLGVVEQKTNQLLSIQAFLENKQSGKDYNPTDLPKFIFGENTEMLPENIIFQPSVQSANYDVDDLLVVNEEERPLSEGELRRKIMEGMVQREKKLKVSRKNKTSPRVLEEPAMAQIPV
ncbi:coiled-coil domain-containing protein 114 [Syngnathoides biaculeatus]|uniref:coiled-coil domain-containing protein 114 n=1 Tax=Syngnathoides biaculeatus TaxID=300417 RepID=UPI002ADE180A|nr:coiled-coil domain-containing protein 114 [Syngnathoides biaculeatus]XP_061688854.1 coiled-coil domain-containing protein 114 [Syngnathoides biaculeatus]